MQIATYTQNKSAGESSTFSRTPATYSIVQVILNLTRLGLDQFLNVPLHRLRQLLGWIDRGVVQAVLLAGLLPFAGWPGVGEGLAPPEFSRATSRHPRAGQATAPTPAQQGVQRWPLATGTPPPPE